MVLKGRARSIPTYLVMHGIGFRFLSKLSVLKAGQIVRMKGCPQPPQSLVLMKFQENYNSLHKWSVNLLVVVPTIVHKHRILYWGWELLLQEGSHSKFHSSERWRMERPLQQLGGCFTCGLPVDTYPQESSTDYFYLIDFDFTWLPIIWVIFL